MTNLDIEQARFNMIEQQIRPWEVLDQSVLDVMAETPRERFVPQRYANLAFADVNIPIGQDQVMMQPRVEARLLQCLSLQPSDRTLEIGTGTGYLTACLARLSQHVVTWDIFPAFTSAAHERLVSLGIMNVTCGVRDAMAEWDEGDSFDAIAVTGSLPTLDPRFQRKLRVGGRLFLTIGEAPLMEALVITRLGEQEWSQISLFETVLPPLINVRTPPRFSF
jgi:protein-L-isoaspartate(D-aspartate) O-methyltransferase